MTGASAFSSSRRAFLQGRPRAKVRLRPPWALDETAFLSACDGCGDCITACPQHVLVTGDGGYPVFEPARGECLFCQKCTDACNPKALNKTGQKKPWSLVAAIAPTCLAKNGVTCFSCSDACGERAIRFGPARGGASPELDPARCTGCGACAAPCPVGAISLSQVETVDG